MSIQPIEEAEILPIADISETLSGLDNQTLAEWWCFLNSVTDSCHWQQCIQVMNVIQEYIGHKACNRQWNIDRMTDEEYESWYTKTYEGKK